VKPAIAVLIVALAAARPASADHEQSRERAIRIAAIAAGIVVYVSSETLFKDEISPDHCRWCGGNTIDDNVREAFLWDNTRLAGQLSNLTGYAAAPLAATGLLIAASSGVPDRWTRIIDDAIPVFEAVIATQLVTQAVKISVARQRPFVRFGGDTVPASPENNLSFFSGHSSLTFSIAVAAGTVAERRGYKLAPVIWVTGLALAGTTAYLRIAADRHYLTDVMTGGAVGAAFGFLFPRLTGSLPAEVSIVPSHNGLALAGSF
jgi:membrane-associated phospholipid phosphatase